MVNPQLNTHTTLASTPVILTSTLRVFLYSDSTPQERVRPEAVEIARLKMRALINLEFLAHFVQDKGRWVMRTT